MNYLIITDIHGSYAYLNKVLSKVKDYDKILILGDLLYHGPRNDLPMEYDTKKVTVTLNELKDKIIAVQGNCDAKIDQMVLEFPLYEHKWLKVNGRRLFLTHGDEFSKERVPTKIFGYTMIYGHFHKNEVAKINRKIKAINLGSLSIPKDGHHSYAIIENDDYVAYDLESDEIIIKEKL